MGPGRAGTASGRAGVSLPEPLVMRLLSVLAAAAGALDAFCIVSLGGAFASVITGNLVQLGRGIATTDERLLLAAAAAVGGYCLGVAVGTAGLVRSGDGWYRRTSAVAAAEVGLLVCVAAGWLVTGGRPGAGAASLLLASAGAAMGMQSAITISTGVRQASTTYLTGTLTAVVRGLAAGRRRGTGTAGGTVRLGALLCGATIGALVLRFVPLWAPAVPVVLVGGVVVVAAAYPPVSGRGRGTAVGTT